MEATTLAAVSLVQTELGDIVTYQVTGYSDYTRPSMRPCMSSSLCQPVDV